MFFYGSVSPCRKGRFRNITHVVTCLISQAKFLTLNDVTREVYWVFLATLQTLLAAPQDVTQFVVAKFKPLRQLQCTQELVKQPANSSFQLLP